ncbi:MAG: flagellar basal body rod modification protein [Tissierellia bacterium]|nr:flagellar basal body rod modification protein [Tissierellia bacterium]
MEIRNYTAMANIFNTTNSASNAAEEARSKLSIDDYLQIMAAELKNQNPFSSGGSNADYLAQMVQFTTLEQLSQISDRLNILTLMNQQQYTFSLIGKEVTVMDGEEEITGIVEKVKFQNGYAVIQVNNKDYNLGSLVEVANPAGTEGEVDGGE